jgi:hypothetical protein
VTRDNARNEPARETVADFFAVVAYCCGLVVSSDIRDPAHFSTYLGSFRVRGFNSSFSLSVDKSRMTGTLLPAAILLTKSRRAVPERNAAADGRLNVFGGRFCRGAIRCITLEFKCSM